MEPNLTPPAPNRFDFDKLFVTPMGEELPADAPGSDRTDSALSARFDSFRKVDDLNWLLEGSEPPAQRSRAPVPGEALDEDDTDIPGIAGADWLDRMAATATDMGKGAIEGPRQMAPEGRLCMIGQIAPPVVGLIPEGEIEAMHRVVGSAGPSPKMTDADRAAFVLIAPFRAGEAVQPINSVPAA